MTPSKLLAKAMARLLGDDAVLSYQDGPKLGNGVEQFVVVAVPTNTPIGLAERRYKNEPDGPDLIETISAFREVSYSVQVYRDSAELTALDRAEVIRLTLQNTRARQHMLTYGLAYTRISEVRDLTEMVDAGNERRAQFDVVYNAVQSLSETILSIESIDIIGTYQGAFSEHQVTIQVRNPQ